MRTCVRGAEAGVLALAFTPPPAFDFLFFVGQSLSTGVACVGCVVFSFSFSSSSLTRFAA